MMIMKIPEPATINHQAIEETADKGETIVPFKKFASQCCKGYAKFAEGPEMGRQYMKIMRMVDRLEDKDKTFTLEDDRMRLFQEAVKAAKWSHPEVNAAYLDFYEAVSEAQDVRAKDPVEEPAKKD